MLSLTIIFFNYLLEAFTNIAFVSNMEALGHACFSEFILEGIVSVLLFSFKLKK